MGNSQSRKKRAAIVDPVVIVICLLAVFLLWSERRAFLGLLKKD